MTTIQKIDNLIQTNEYKVEISSYTDVYLDDYEQGELEHRNSWVNDKESFYIEKEHLRETLKEELEEYITDTLYAEYKFEWLKESLTSYDDTDTAFFYSNFVDVDNTTPTEDQIQNWKDGKEELFNQSISIVISIDGTDIPISILRELLL